MTHLPSIFILGGWCFFFFLNRVVEQTGIPDPCFIKILYSFCEEIRGGARIYFRIPDPEFFHFQNSTIFSGADMLLGPISIRKSKFWIEIFLGGTSRSIQKSTSGSIQSYPKNPCKQDCSTTLMKITNNK